MRSQTHVGLATVPSGGPLNFGGADGCCVDDDGRIVVGAPATGGITVFSPDGELLGALQLDDPMTTNVAFDARNRALVITLASTGRVVVVDDWPHPFSVAATVIEQRYYPATYADERPFAPAVILACTADTTSWRQLDERSTRIARLFRDIGLRSGDTVALLMENHPAAYEIVWAVLRSGLRYTFVNSMLTTGEAVEIIDSASAPVLVCSSRFLALGQRHRHRASCSRASLRDRFSRRSAARAATPRMVHARRRSRRDLVRPTRRRARGCALWFSSGTSGHPKGVLRSLPDAPAGTLDDVARSYGDRYRFGPSTVHLTAGPLHHAAPIGFSTMVQRFGGTVILTERFDAEEMLRYIEQYRVTFTHVVPTMFVRLLKLPVGRP